MKLSTGAKTDIGRKRSQNQDSMSTHPELGLFVVADGMGGHQGGETASAMSVTVIPEAFKSLKEKNWDNCSAIKKSIEEANLAIHQKSTEEPKLTGMGTTTVSLLIDGSTAFVGHVGDSRCYFMREGQLWQLTRDHSLVQEKLKAGIITRSQLRTDKMKNVITRSVGFEPGVEIDVYELQTLPGDLFLLCSDGLSGPLNDEHIFKTLTDSANNNKTIQETADLLISEANRMGGDDNITAVLVKVES
ncbi:MAG: Stp1/IreP family PP2C-type Ser/Thr phosphatase [Xanthomonadaceae bacterium]|nr:Stp1/IreP family PP2C-type Ser/Thr phosphatase [Xanthomonadaceae bacterium]